MEFEKKVLSREIQQYLYESGLTVGSAESCTGGRIAEAIIAVPGASTYFKGGVISYTNEVKENLLGVDHQLLEEKTAVCEEVISRILILFFLSGSVISDIIPGVSIISGLTKVIIAVSLPRDKELKTSVSITN